MHCWARIRCPFWDISTPSGTGELQISLRIASFVSLLLAYFLLKCSAWLVIGYILSVVHSSTDTLMCALGYSCAPGSKWGVSNWATLVKNDIYWTSMFKVQLFNGSWYPKTSTGFVIRDSLSHIFDHLNDLFRILFFVKILHLSMYSSHIIYSKYMHVVYI